MSNTGGVGVTDGSGQVIGYNSAFGDVSSDTATSDASAAGDSSATETTASGGTSGALGGLGAEEILLGVLTGGASLFLPMLLGGAMPGETMSGSMGVSPTGTLIGPASQGAQDTMEASSAMATAA